MFQFEIYKGYQFQIIMLRNIPSLEFHAPAAYPNHHE